MPPLYLLELALAVAIAVLSPVRGPEGTVQAVDGVHVLAPARERQESWYALEVGRIGPDGRERPEIVGLACLRRSVLPGGPRLEAEFRFARDVRVLLVEEPTPAGRRLVYRELAEHGGRSLLLEELAPGDYSLLEWGGPEKLSGPLGCDGVLAFPLELAEAARVGRVRDGLFEAFDPLAGGPVRLLARTDARSFDPGDPAEEFEVRYERDDGTLAAFYRIRSGQVVEFQLQRGGPRARLATRVEVAEARRRLGIVSPP